MWLIIGTIAILLVLAVFVSEALVRRRVRARFKGRPTRTDEEFGETFYPEAPKIAAKIREVLSRHLEIDISRIEPQDEPVKDLCMDELDSMSTVEFIMALEELFGIKIEDQEATTMKTLDDICRFIIKKKQNENH